MKNRIKKLTAIGLCLLLILSVVPIVPINASAAEINGRASTGAGETETYVVTCRLGVKLRSSYSTDSTAYLTMPNGATFTVTEKYMTGGYYWGKTTYNGYTGWTALLRVDHQEIYSQVSGTFYHSLHAWVSIDGSTGTMAEAPFYTGTKYYFWGKLYDPLFRYQEIPLTDVMPELNVNMTFSVTGPNSYSSSYTYSNCSENWYAITPGSNSAGTFSCTVSTSGDAGNSVGVSFTIDSYSVYFNANGGTVSTSSKTVINGSSYGSLPTPTKSGCSFSGWYTSASGGNKITDSTRVDLRSNQTLYAHWSDYSSPSISLSSTNHVSESQTLYISMSDNNELAGYYFGTNSNYSSNSYYSNSMTVVDRIISSPGTYYVTARDSAGNMSSTVSITFYKTTLNANGGSVSPTSILTKSGNSFNLPTPTRNGFSYNGWSTSSSATSGIRNLSPSSNSTYYAVWSLSPTSIGLNETKTVNINSAGEIAYYTYTPAARTRIRFYSTGNSDTYAYLYDSSMNELIHDDDSSSGSNFQITYTLEANKKYYFGCKFYSSSSTGSYSVTLERDRKSLSDCTITLNQSSCYFDNTAKKPSLLVKDESTTLYENTDYTVTYSNNTNVGTATVTITGIGNYKDSVNKTFTISYESISLNAAKSINISTAGTMRYFCFVPSSNMSVRFYSMGSVDTYGHLYNADLNQLISNDDGGENNNFMLSYDLKAGTTYIFACRLCSSSNTGTFDVKLEQTNIDTQSPTVSISSTNNVSSSQTVTISLSDNVGIKGYYWGTSSSYSNNTYTTTSNTSISKTISSSGTYYATAVDTSGNISSTVSITFYKTTLNVNGGSVSTTSVLTKSGNSLYLPTPTRSGNYSFNGWSTDPSATSGVYVIYPNKDDTYYALWSYVDTQKPTVSLSATNNVASSQTVTISLSDNVGIKGYYWGTSPSYSNNTYTTTSNTSISKTVDSAGTYYATAIDTSGNVSSTVSITFYKTTLNANGGSVSPTSVLTKSGNSFTFPTPTRSNYTYVGWGTSSSATSGVKTLSPSSNATYYAVWQISYETITLNSSKTINISTAGAVKYFKFTPSSNVSVKFYSTGDKDTYGYIYDANLNLIDENDDGGNNYNFRISYALKANTTYIFACKLLYSSEIGSFEIKLEEKAITEPVSFTWGRDNLNFNNWAEYYSTNVDYHGNPLFTYRDLISPEYLEILKNNLSPSEYQTVFVRNGNKKSWLDDTWGGSCYGMAIVELLALEGVINASDVSSRATSIHDFSAPVNDSSINTLINYYFMLQIKPHMRNQMRTVPGRSNEENIKNILSLLDEYGVAVVGIDFGHEILAYGHEIIGNYTYNGVTYNGKIYIHDPNRATDNYSSLDEVCIYYNTRTYSWTIPLYERRYGYSSRNGHFNHISSDVEELNEGGYMNSNNSNLLKNFMARLDAYEISDNRLITKVSRNSNGGYINKTSGEDDIQEAYSTRMWGTDDRIQGYNLKDTSSAYRISQTSADKLDLNLDYGNCTLSASSAAGKSIIFDNDGYIEVNGEAADYTLEMVYNDNYPTDWFAIRASGHNSYEASLQMANDGYILSSDNLHDVRLNANNKENSAEITFSTDYSSVFIYEIDENTIGLKVDTDGNGTYETDLPTETFEIGDANLDGKINISDVTAIQRHVAEFAMFNDEQLAVADTNGDGVVTIDDATHLQRYLAEFDVVLG